MSSIHIATAATAPIPLCTVTPVLVSATCMLVADTTSSLVAAVAAVVTRMGSRRPCRSFGRHLRGDCRWNTVCYINHGSSPCNLVAGDDNILLHQLVRQRTAEARISYNLSDCIRLPQPISPYHHHNHKRTLKPSSVHDRS